jgi:hypothetical protein
MLLASLFISSEMAAELARILYKDNSAKKRQFSGDK